METAKPTTTTWTTEDALEGRAGRTTGRNLAEDGTTTTNKMGGRHAASYQYDTEYAINFYLLSLSFNIDGVVATGKLSTNAYVLTMHCYNIF